MAKEKNGSKEERGDINDRYLIAMFKILKKKESVVFADQRTHFNDTELRLIGEVLSAKYDGERLISTQLAQRLGVTRSAISQIVNRLESEGVVRRVSDAVDRKIAYIEVTDQTTSAYEEDVKTCSRFVGRIVDRFGEERFWAMCADLETFISCVEKEREKSK